MAVLINDEKNCTVSDVKTLTTVLTQRKVEWTFNNIKFWEFENSKLEITTGFNTSAILIGYICIWVYFIYLYMHIIFALIDGIFINK